MNKCISYKNKKNKNILCNRKCIINSNYCGLHSKKNTNNNKKYSIKIILNLLNKNKINNLKNKINNLYKKKYVKIFDNYQYENLMSIYESFEEIPIENLIYLDNKIWDINLLAYQWANLLCSTEMQNSSPIFPSNPFTRKNINFDDIKNILNILKINKIKIYKPLKYLLENSYRIINDTIEYNTDFNLSRKIINILEEKFRFRLLNIKNSQDCYIGIWIDKCIQKSDFEIFFDYYDKLPMQIHGFYGEIIDNYEKTETKCMLDNYPKEKYDINEYLD